MKPKIIYEIIDIIIKTYDINFNFKINLIEINSSIIRFIMNNKSKQKTK